MTSAPFLQRHLGDYLLVAQLSDDPLGTVFRALYAVDERRFVRLRILRSEDLLPAPIEKAISRHAGSLGGLVHDALVSRPQLDSVDGIPFMTWDEAAGWTLDTMLARVRAFGIRIPAEYALLIAERVATALEHAQRAGGDGPEARHGLLWPGFITISYDAAVRVGGFGVADGIRPSLSRGRISAEIAPYVAPEARTGRSGPSSDVYSLGAILVELLTARRPAPDGPSAELRAADPRSDELQRFLQRCLAPEAERFATPADAHRALQQIVTGNPFSLYTANLALFLYKLLNPESQSVAPSSDWESTNPVVMHGRTPAAPPEPGPAPVSAPAETETPAVAPSARVPPEPVVEARGEVVETVEAADPLEALAPEAAEATAEVQDDAPFAAAESAVERLSLWRDAGPASASASASTFNSPLGAAAPIEVVTRATRLLGEAPGRRAAAGAEWRRPAAALAAAAGLTVAVFLVASRISLPASREMAPVARLEKPVAGGPAAPAVAIAAPASASASASLTSSSTTAAESLAPAEPAAMTANVPRAQAIRLASVHKARAVAPELRRPAEEQRLRAALARIEADRVNAREAAGDIFGEGRHSEEEGERLLRAQEYESAQLAFSRAASLFQKAQELSWEDKVRRSSLSGTP